MKPEQIPREIIDKIQATYSEPGKLRTAVKYWYANIPERLWEDDYDKEKYKSIDNKNKQFLVFAKNKKQIKIVSDILKFYIDLGKDCIRQDFFDLMSAVCHYNEIDINNVMTHFSNFDVIAITGIKVGELYDSYEQRFVIMLENILNDRFSKILILGFEKIPEGKFAEGYGKTLNEFIEENSFDNLC